MSAPDNTDVILLTPEGHKRLEAELQHLTTVRRKEIADRMRDSKEHGEFSEGNTELDEVKFEQAMVEGRIVDIRSILANCHIIQPSEVTTREVGIGSKVTVVSRARGRKQEFSILLVSSVEADPDHDRVSNESPLGEALMGRRKGEKVTVMAPSGKIEYEIKNIAKGIK